MQFCFVGDFEDPCHCCLLSTLNTRCQVQKGCNKQEVSCQSLNCIKPTIEFFNFEERGRCVICQGVDSL